MRCFHPHPVLAMGLTIGWGMWLSRWFCHWQRLRVETAGSGCVGAMCASCSLPWVVRGMLTRSYYLLARLGPRVLDSVRPRLLNRGGRQSPPEAEVQVRDAPVTRRRRGEGEGLEEDDDLD